MLINKIGSKDETSTLLGGTYTGFINTLLEVCRTADTDELKNPYNAQTALWSNFKTAELKFKGMHNTMSLNSLTSSYVAPADGEPVLPTSYVYDLNGGKAMLSALIAETMGLEVVRGVGLREVGW